MNAKTENCPPAAIRASDADRDAVLSDLGEHFQAGRLTSAEFDERTGWALAARTWGELEELVADLPAAGPASQSPAPAATTLPQPASRHAAPPLIVLAGIAIAAIVLVHMAHGGGWGLIWPLLGVLFIARPMIHRFGASTNV